MALTMTFETWLAYVLAYTAISLIPGPSVFMVLGQALSRGPVAAVLCILGDLLGGVVVMTVSYGGLGIILATSSTAYAIIKWAGVGYMAWLGVSQIAAARRLRKTDLKEIDMRGRGSASMFAGFLTGVLNPKAILFYVAFLAQFIDPAGPALPQFLVLMATSTIIVFLVLSTYAFLASLARKRLQNLRARKNMGYVGGTLLIGGSALMATNR